MGFTSFGRSEYGIIFFVNGIAQFESTIIVNGAQFESTIVGISIHGCFQVQSPPSKIFCTDDFKKVKNVL